MRCPFCSCAETRVVDSRAADEGDQTRRRRRECTECKERFTTYEAAELNPPRIIKSDGRREDFDEEKLLTGLRRALGKRPVGEEKVRAAVAHVMHRLRALGDREVKSGKIGELVMRELRDLDHVAYVRFASVYRNFGDVRAFLEEIEDLKNELPPELKANQLDLLADENPEN